MRLALKVSELTWRGARFVATSCSLQQTNPAGNIVLTSKAVLYMFDSRGGRLAWHSTIKEMGV